MPTTESINGSTQHSQSMAAITFPSSPTVNDTFTASGKSWTWTGTVWHANATMHSATHATGGADELSPEAIGAASIEELSAHTGSASAHSVATISGLSDALAGKQAAGEYATAAQGALAESALQEAAAFATSAQGVKADSALQPGTPIASISGLQTELDGKQNAGAFATADQGAKADSAVQVVNGTISVPAPDGGMASIGPVDSFGGMCSLRSFNAYGQTFFVIYSPDGSAAVFTSADGGIFRIQAATKAQVTSSSSGEYSLPLEVGMFVSQLGRNQGSPIAWDTISAFQGNGRIVTTAETEQFRLAYDAENYLTITVGRTGIVTFEVVGSAAGFAGVATASQGAKADSALQAESDPAFSAWLEMAKADGDDSLQAGYANYVGNITSANWSDLRSIFSVLAQGDGTSSLTNDSGFLTDATAFASAAQGALADTALQPAGDGSQLTGVLKPGDLNNITVNQANNATHAVDSQTAWRADTAIAVESLSGHNVSELTNDTGFLSDASAFATAAQGALADTALQDASAFATAAQGTLVDAFVSGTTMVEGSNYADYANHATPGSPLETEIAGKATSEQGAKADTAVQPADLATASVSFADTAGNAGYADSANRASLATWADNAAKASAADRAGELYQTVLLAASSLQDAAAFATAAQGALAVSALQDAAAFATASHLHSGVYEASGTATAVLAAHTGSTSAHSLTAISGLDDALAGRQAVGSYAAAPVYSSTAPVTNLVEGMCWVKTDTLAQYVYYNGAWVMVSTGAVFGSSSANITANRRSPILAYSAQDVVTELGTDSIPRITQITDSGFGGFAKHLTCSTASGDGLAQLVVNTYNGLPCIRSLGINGEHLNYVSNEDGIYLPEFTLYVVANIDSENSDYWGCLFGTDPATSQTAGSVIQISTWLGHTRSNRAFYAFGLQGSAQGETYPQQNIINDSGSNYATGRLYVYSLRGCVKRGEPLEVYFQLRQCNLSESVSSLNATQDCMWITKLFALAGFNGDNRSAVDLCEVVMYDTMHSNSLQDVVIEELSAKWGALTTIQ